VRGAAAVSATLSVGAVTVVGKSLNQVILGYQAIENVTSYSFSGSWSDIVFLEIRASYRSSGTASASIAVFTDGGTTPFLSAQSVVTVGDPTFLTFEGEVWGVNNTAQKQLLAVWRRASSGATSSDISFTATAGFINCVRVTHGRTLSSGTAIAIGWRTS
jgi:hypothetical protein